MREGLGLQRWVGGRGAWDTRISPHWSAGVNPERLPGVSETSLPESKDQGKSRSGHTRAPLSGAVLGVKALFSPLPTPWLGPNLEEQP